MLREYGRLGFEIKLRQIDNGQIVGTEWGIVNEIKSVILTVVHLGGPVLDQGREGAARDDLLEVLLGDLVGDVHHPFLIAE